MPAEPLLYRLVYVSKIAASERTRLQQCIRSILTVAQHRNARDGLTRILVASNASFAQALEGERDAVERTFGRICKDPRHSTPAVVMQGEVETREFLSWTMCARQLSVQDNVILDRLEQRGGFNPATNPAAALFGMLQGVGRVHQAYFDQQQGPDVVYV